MREKAEVADVVIVGTGAAGLFCALNLPQNLKIYMITKDEAQNSNSFLAQGGIATLKSQDDYEAYFEDTMRAGHYKNNKASVETMIKSSPEIIDDLINYGVDFARDEEGLAYTREGAHSISRILHHDDITGREITSKLLEEAKTRANIQITEFMTMVDIIVEHNTCKGVIAYDKQKKLHAIYAKAVVFATGGIGGLFKFSTNFKHITGDAFAIAINHGIELQDVNYIQIHPTVLYTKDEGRRFLISESVRGEGAILLNEEGNRFVDELQPRDVVTAAIKKQMQKYNTEYVYLSMRNMDKNAIQPRFPNIYKRCLEEGYDLRYQDIPVTPAQHYFMGGIKTDLDAKTSMENLFAVGEAGCNGVHGANRLASNSLLESLVFSKRGANAIEKNIGKIDYEFVTLNLDKYNNLKELQKKYKQLIMEEIKKRDREFYDKWCSDENQCG
ncbi:MAG: L-aspartate oxidase [Clostridia bacterium]|nr:L-aspartate oxidase [Clostridia bacterium]MDD4571104.1 L-aspartate oxidase [Clostridia bacterium]